MPPKLEIVKPAPFISLASRLPSLALEEIIESSSESSIKDFLPTSRITGTTRPFGVSTAIPILKNFFKIKFSLFSSSEALKFG